MDWLATGLDVATARLSALLDSVDAATGSSTTQNQVTSARDDIHWDYTITEKTLEFVEALAEHHQTFTQFPPSHETFELTARQEKHARDVLSASSSFARLRYRMCPSRLREHEFWRIYFTLLHGVLKRMDEMKQADSKSTSLASPTASSSFSSSSTTTNASSTTPSASTSTESSVPRVDFLAEIDRLCGIANLSRTAATHRVDHDVDSDAEDDSARRDASVSRAIASSPTAVPISSSVCAPSDMSVLSDVDVDDSLPDDAALEAAVREHGDVDGETLNLDLQEDDDDTNIHLQTPKRTNNALAPSPIPGLSSGLLSPASPSPLDSSTSSITSHATP